MSVRISPLESLLVLFFRLLLLFELFLNLPLHISLSGTFDEKLMPIEDRAFLEDDLIAEELPEPLSKLFLFLVIFINRVASIAMVVIYQLGILEILLDIVLQFLAIGLVLNNTLAVVASQPN